MISTSWMCHGFLLSSVTRSLVHFEVECAHSVRLVKVLKYCQSRSRRTFMLLTTLTTVELLLLQQTKAREFNVEP